MKILCIGAHQDDNEFRVGGMTQKWVKAGYEVVYLSMCNGDGGHHIMTPEETTKRRAGESAKVAEYLGIRYDVWSDVHDCTLMPTLELRERLIRYIRALSPDLIVAHRPNDTTQTTEPQVSSYRTHRTFLPFPTPALTCPQ